MVLPFQHSSTSDPHHAEPAADSLLLTVRSEPARGLGSRGSRRNDRRGTRAPHAKSPEIDEWQICLPKHSMGLPCMLTLTPSQPPQCRHASGIWHTWSGVVSELVPCSGIQIETSHPGGFINEKSHTLVPAEVCGICSLLGFYTI